MLPPASTVSGLPRFTLLPGVSCIISNNDSVDRASHSKINPPTYRDNNIRFGSRSQESFPSVLSSATAALDQRSRPRRRPCPSSAGRMYHLACFVVHGVCLYLCFKKWTILSHIWIRCNVDDEVSFTHRALVQLSAPRTTDHVSVCQLRSKSTTVPADRPISIFSWHSSASTGGD